MPPHDTQGVTEWVDEYDVNHVLWPSQSPDSYPVATFWTNMFTTIIKIAEFQRIVESVPRHWSCSGSSWHVTCLYILKLSQKQHLCSFFSFSGFFVFWSKQGWKKQSPYLAYCYITMICWVGVLTCYSVWKAIILQQVFIIFQVWSCT